MKFWVSNKNSEKINFSNLEISLLTLVNVNCNSNSFYCGILTLFKGLSQFTRVLNYPTTLQRRTYPLLSVRATQLYLRFVQDWTDKILIDLTRFSTVNWRENSNLQRIRCIKAPIRTRGPLTNKYSPHRVNV